MTLKIKQRLAKTLKGQHHSPKTEFKKGQVSIFKGKHHTKEAIEKLRKRNIGKKLTKKTRNKIKNSIHKHHIYLKENSDEIMLLNPKKHIKLHYTGYEYLVETGQIRKYLKWFDKKYGLKCKN